ncbi:TPA: hypothetical protein I7290_24295 [Vibrio parahaemolyticus]|nr:hypothetical protein [Vibrio parahaemolyticus]
MDDKNGTVINEKTSYERHISQFVEAYNEFLLEGKARGGEFPFRQNNTSHSAKVEKRYVIDFQQVQSIGYLYSRR